MQNFLRLTLRCPAAREEILAAELWSLHTLGLEIRHDGADLTEVRAYFPAKLAGHAPGPAVLRIPGVRLVRSEVLDSKDWMAAYRAQARPVDVGRHLFVDPREPDGPPPVAPPGRHLLRLPARTAYGTGSHASTRLAVEYLEELPLPGATVLDVGSGSGILSFAALLFGARFVAGLEIDCEAALIGGQNRRLNQLRPGLIAGDLECLGVGARFDFAVANILPGSFLHQLPLLVDRLAAGGSAIFSGIPTENASEVEARLAECGLRIASRQSEGRWTAYLAEAA